MNRKNKKAKNIKKQRGKVIARAAAVAGLLVLVAASGLLKDLALEQYWLRRLESPDREARRLAVARLSALRSRLALERMIEISGLPAFAILIISVP